MLSKILLFVAMFSLAVTGFAKGKSSESTNGETAPVFCTRTILIHAQPEKVWAVLTNIDHWNEWLPSVKWSHLNGPLAPNSSFNWKTGGAKIHSILRIVKPYSSLGWTGKVYGIAAVHNWTFKVVNGATEVTVSESMKGFLAGTFKKYFNKTLEKDMIESLEQLKKACE